MQDTQWTNLAKAICDPVRLEILKLIISNPGITGKELLAHIKSSQAIMSLNITKLKQFEIIDDIKDGQSHRYYINRQTVDNITKCLNSVLMFISKKK